MVCKKSLPGLRPSNVQKILSPLGPDAPPGTLHAGASDGNYGVIHVDHLQGDEVVAVEVKPAAIEELLPPSLKQKKFGGS